MKFLQYGLIWKHLNQNVLLEISFFLIDESLLKSGLITQLQLLQLKLGERCGEWKGDPGKNPFLLQSLITLTFYQGSTQASNTGPLRELPLWAISLTMLFS